MKIGIVCPYSFDVPGGVQFHVRDLAQYLIAKGHPTSVLAPADEGADLPSFITPAGRALAVRYNGSVARVNFGPGAAGRVSRWLDQGDFDVIHLHEPVTPSLALLALWSADVPVVATFHTSNIRSRAMQAAYPVLRPSLEKIGGRIAVSEDARRTVTTHLGGDAVVIPNGVDTAIFAKAQPNAQWQGTPAAPTLAFLGRVDEPRKGLAIIVRALDELLLQWPGLRVLVAGPGDPSAAFQGASQDARAACTMLGAISDSDKASLLSSVDAYIAPHLGGESFGIVLVEAMAAGAPIVASDLPAFVRVLGDGGAGLVFPTGNPHACAEAVSELLANRQARTRASAAGQKRAATFDWSVVAEDIIAVYETVIGAPAQARHSPNLHAGSTEEH